MKCPREAAEVGSEFSHQSALFMWANMAAHFGLTAAYDEASYSVKGHALLLMSQNNDTVPQLARLFAVKNQGHGSAIRGGRSKQEGVKAGVPDIMLPWPNSKWGQHGLWIEMKKRKGGVVSDEQVDWHEYLEGVGYVVEVSYTWLEARAALLRYLEL